MVIGLCCPLICGLIAIVTGRTATDGVTGRTMTKTTMASKSSSSPSLGLSSGAMTTSGITGAVATMIAATTGVMIVAVVKVGGRVGGIIADRGGARPLTASCSGSIVPKRCFASGILAGHDEDMTAPLRSAAIGSLAVLLVSVAASAKAAEKGRLLAESLCARCHMNEGQGEKRGPMGVPSFGAIANRPNQSIQGIVGWLRSAPKMMPDHRLTQEEIHDLARFILSLRRRSGPVPQRVQGRE
jgi:mono/diheme cytochrome c family protein